MPTLLSVTYVTGPGQRALSLEERAETARNVARIPGLLHKYWIENDATHHRGGIYIFESAGAAEDWSRKVRVSLSEAGGTEIAISAFDINEGLSEITRVTLPERPAAGT